jgi:hypothetical protein
MLEVRGRFARLGVRAVAVALFACVVFASPAARADGTNRDQGWRTATNYLAVSAGAVELIMPRVFYSDPEITVGWKARWHVSVLAPTMTLATIAFFNEVVLKKDIKGKLPGCDDTNPGDPNCLSYGFMSSQAFAAFAAAGQGTGIFLADTLKWSHGNVNAGALIGHVAVPLILGTITTVGRTAGNLESGGQAWGSAGIGLVSGLGMGLLYGLMQRPECGYTGSLICW